MEKKKKNFIPLKLKQIMWINRCLSDQNKTSNIFTLVKSTKGGLPRSSVSYAKLLKTQTLPDRKLEYTKLKVKVKITLKRARLVA